MMEPYWSDGVVTVFHGDCREVTEWLSADVLVTDPPYGVDWKSGGYNGASKHRGIAGDRTTASRDAIRSMWGNRPAVMFGDLRLPVPDATQVLVYAKPADAGLVGSVTGFRRDTEGIYLLGGWPQRVCERSSVVRTNSRSGPGMQTRYGHPHAKPVDVMETLIAACPPGVIADPFAGSGSTLVAARNQGRRAIGVEIEERYCEAIVKRLAQADLFTEAS